MITLKRTPLYDAHVKAGARFLEFGGWDMPIQYSGIVDEHLAVRRAAGLFDISHMGEVLVTGPGAGLWLNRILTNDAAQLKPGQAQYSLMCNERGGVIDDLYLYRLEEQRFLLIINASRIDADWDWLQTQYDAIPTEDGLQLSNASDDFGGLALQGPHSASLIDEVIPGGSIGGKLVASISELAKNETATFVFRGITLHVSRTGYTGEDGFELIAPPRALAPLWDELLRVGHSRRLQPAGLGARDTLRTEACYPLYGQELDEQTSPIEAGLGYFVAWNKGEFIGRSVLADQKERGPARKCVAFVMKGKTPPPRPHYPIHLQGSQGPPLGEVTSGTQSPSLGLGIGLGYVPCGQAQPGHLIEIEIRGRRFAAEVVKKPIYKKPSPDLNAQLKVHA